MRSRVRNNEVGKQESREAAPGVVHAVGRLFPVSLIAAILLFCLVAYVGGAIVAGACLLLIAGLIATVGIFGLIKRRSRRAASGSGSAEEDAAATHSFPNEKSRLLATASHEIRTPLAAIMGMTDLLGQTNLSLEQASYLNGIRQSGQSLLQLVEDLLDHVTLDAGRFAIHPKPDSLRHLIDSVVEMLAYKAHAKGIEIAVVAAADLPDRLVFDPARLRQVLFNVIGNATKFTREGGILIRAFAQEGEVVITVRDSGIGMTQDEVARIFEPFEQGAANDEPADGTGLGLSISSRIMTAMNGRLSVSSEKGEGSFFTIAFPLEAAIGGKDRQGALVGISVFLFVPDGPVAVALAETIETLGGTCRVIGSGMSADDLLRELSAGTGGLRPSQDVLIVDHRLMEDYATRFAPALVDAAPDLRKVVLVNPEKRGGSVIDRFDAWLIRPLREQSLVDVLKRQVLLPHEQEEPGLQPRGSEDSGLGRDWKLVPARLAGAPLEILLAEDDPVNALLVTAVLARAGYRVRRVEDFDALREELESSDHRIDLVLMDLAMPGGNGLSVLAEIRRREVQRGAHPVPIIVMTADRRAEVARQAQAHGVLCLLPKPVDPKRLIDEIAHAVPSLAMVASS